jgi:hypothetical protein
MAADDGPRRATGEPDPQVSEVSVVPRVIRSLLPAAVVLCLLAQPVAAARPTHDRFLVDETFQEELCGIEVTTHLLVKGNVLVFEDHLVDVSLVRLTHTNADGAWLENLIAGPVMIQEQLEGDLLTIVSRHVGIHERLRSSESLTAAFDRGQIIFRDVIDLNDLEDPDDDELVSSEILFQAGPHPESDSEFALFCEVVIDVLG